MAVTNHVSGDVDMLGDVLRTDLFMRTARAYCGPAHGQCWIVDTDIEVQSVVWLEGAAESAAYRVTFDPATRRPARDRLGNVVYMPVR